jgi:hypothetical protein
VLQLICIIMYVGLKRIERCGFGRGVGDGAVAAFLKPWV